MSWWGPWFPDAADTAGTRSWWGPWFPERVATPTVVTTSGPATFGTFAMDWTGLKARYSWQSDVFKSQSGLERRAQPDDLPGLSLQGSALVPFVDVLTKRAAFAEYAAAGKPFLLGIPFEALPATFAGAVASVPTTTLSDWIVPGQRVIALSSDRATSVVAVIQSSTSTSITLDTAPGFALGDLMPAMAYYLDSQQSFQRYQASLSSETWSIAGRQIGFGYESGASKQAFVDLATHSAGVLAGVVVLFVTPGMIGNGATLTLVGDDLTAPGTLTVTGANQYTYHFLPGVTRILDFLNAIAGSNLTVTGSWASSLAHVTAFGPVTLAGGSDKNWGLMGVGASVTTYGGSPVYDRPLPPGTDAMISMAELLDLGGVPLQFQTATVPDWARAVKLERLDISQWQWFKAFLVATRGKQVAYWLPTWRADMTAVTLTPGTLKVATSADFTAWYPTLRTQVQIMTPDGAVQYAQITAQVDNGDGTRSLTIVSSNAAYSAGGGGAAVTPSLVSWLDYCHWESDDFEVSWSDGMTFSYAGTARTVQR